jgi:hypothetical protein
LRRDIAHFALLGSVSRYDGVEKNKTGWIDVRVRPIRRTGVERTRPIRREGTEQGYFSLFKPLIVIKHKLYKVIKIRRAMAHFALLCVRPWALLCCTLRIPYAPPYLAATVLRSRTLTLLCGCSHSHTRPARRCNANVIPFSTHTSTT